MDRNYGIFVLGYDLLQDRLKESNVFECDTAYAICGKIFDEFIYLSNLDSNYSQGYGELQQYVTDKLFDFEKDTWSGTN
jgi:hypothetical protein